MKHTPTPWSRNIRPVSRYPVIFSGRNRHVLHVVTRGLLEEEAEENAEFVLCAVNSHEALIAALIKIEDLLRIVEEFSGAAQNARRIAQRALVEAKGDADEFSR